MKVWNNRHPVVLVPTNYFTTPTDEFRKHSTLQNNNILDVSMVIWANHNVRAAVKAMQDTTNQIKKTESLLNLPNLVPVKELFRLQNEHGLEKDDQKYL